MREIRTTLLPNGEQQVQAGGDFVYVDYVDREIKLMIHDQIITVNPGDKVRPARPFKSVTVINPDDTNPVAVVLKVGEGDYNSQIIRGDVSITPVLKYEDGTSAPDTRRDIELMLHITSQQNQSYAKGELKRTVVLETNTGGAPSYSGRYVCQFDNGFLGLGPANSEDTVYRWDANGGYLGQVALADLDDPAFPGMEVPDQKLQGITVNTRRGVPVVVTLSGDVYQLIGGAYYPAPLFNLNFKIEHGYPAGYLTNNKGKGWKGLAYNAAENVLYVAFPGVKNGNDPDWTDKTTVYCVDADTGEEKQAFEVPWIIAVTSDMEYWPEEKGVAIVQNGSLEIYILKVETGELVNFPSGSVRAASRNARGREYSIIKSNPQNTVEIYSESEREIWAEGYAVSRDCSGSTLVKPELIVTEANVFLVPQAKGKSLVMGEVIKAIIELSTGLEAPDDYLNHVFGIDIQGQPLAFKAGGQSFAAINKADDFVIETPARVRLTVDQEL